MKYLITVFLLLFAVSARAQITLEHTYLNTHQFALVEVDSAVWKYVNFNGSDSITLFNLDHSLDRVILVPILPSGSYPRLLLIARRLFDPDSLYEYMLTSNTFPVLRVLREDGSLLFSCDTCELGTRTSGAYDEGFEYPDHLYGFTSTEQGTKMIILTQNANVEVYSLPGKLPSCSATPLSAVNPSTAYTNPTLPTSTYPNPSSGQVRIAYELPSGVSSGDLILTTEDGREVKRFCVTNAFGDLLIESGDLPSGSYFYKLVTEKGQSQAQKISLVK